MTQFECLSTLVIRVKCIVQMKHFMLTHSCPPFKHLLSERQQMLFAVLRDDSALRTLSSLRGLRGAPKVPPLCREPQASQTAVRLIGVVFYDSIIENLVRAVSCMGKILRKIVRLYLFY